MRPLYSLAFLPVALLVDGASANFSSCAKALEKLSRDDGKILENFVGDAWGYYGEVLKKSDYVTCSIGRGGTTVVISKRSDIDPGVLDGGGYRGRAVQINFDPMGETITRVGGYCRKECPQ